MARGNAASGGLNVPEMHILVVEDEAAIADFLQRGLKAEGHAVTTAFDGDEGERRALGEDVDLVILDVMLPGKGGLDVLQPCASAARPCR